MNLKFDAEEFGETGPQFGDVRIGHLSKGETKPILCDDSLVK